MKKAFLYAYDRQNLGDDLFVYTITKGYPHVQFYIWTDKENMRTFQCLSNLKCIDPDSRLVHFLHKLRPSLVARYRAWLENRCDAVVYIGGSIFMEYPNWAQILTWWEYEAENRPFYALGANFGPWHTEAYRQKMDEIFAKMRDVCFRDRYSEGLFPGNPSVRRAPDILFSWPIPQVAVKEKQLFVSVIDCAGRDESHGLSGADAGYVKNMAGLLSRYLADGWHVVLGSFCREEGDERGIRKILNALEDTSHVAVLAYDGTNAQELLNALAESEYVVATRFHATILALAAGRPVLPVLYSDKTANVLQDLGFEGTVYDLRREGPWDYDESLRNWRCPWALSREIREEAHGHFEKLDRVLR